MRLHTTGAIHLNIHVNNGSIRIKGGGPVHVNMVGINNGSLRIKHITQDTDRLVEGNYRRVETIEQREPRRITTTGNDFSDFVPIDPTPWPSGRIIFQSRPDGPSFYKHIDDDTLLPREQKDYYKQRFAEYYRPNGQQPIGYCQSNATSGHWLIYIRLHKNEPPMGTLSHEIYHLTKGLAWPWHQRCVPKWLIETVTARGGNLNEEIEAHTYEKLSQHIYAVMNKRHPQHFTI